MDKRISTTALIEFQVGGKRTFILSLSPKDVIDAPLAPFFPT